MHMYFKNIPAKFQPDPIWNDGHFLDGGRPDKKRKNKHSEMNIDMGSVPDPDMCRV